MVVFKFPERAASKNHVPMNYIKRLIGLPGETIAIYDGDLYVLHGRKLRATGPTTPGRSDLDPLAASVACTTTRRPATLFRDGQVPRSSASRRDKILAMRRLVYDNDHQAEDLSTSCRRAGPGRPAAAGRPTTSQRRSRDAGAGGQIGWLRYRHIVAAMPPAAAGTNRPQLITDFMGYNTGQPRPAATAAARQLGRRPDARVRGDGRQGRRASWSWSCRKGVDRFQARCDLATGTCTLVRLEPAARRRGAGQQADRRSSKPGTYRLRFANVDERLTRVGRTATCRSATA